MTYVDYEKIKKSPQLNEQIRENKIYLTVLNNKNKLANLAASFYCGSTESRFILEKTF